MFWTWWCHVALCSPWCAMVLWLPPSLQNCIISQKYFWLWVYPVISTLFTFSHHIICSIKTVMSHLDHVDIFCEVEGTEHDLLTWEKWIRKTVTCSETSCMCGCVCVHVCTCLCVWVKLKGGMDLQPNYLMMYTNMQTHTLILCHEHAVKSPLCPYDHGFTILVQILWHSDL